VKNWQRIEEAALPHLAVFLPALANPLPAQHRQLREILHANRETVFGRKHGFASISSYQEFCQKVPPHTYEDLAPYIQRMAAGETGILCADAVTVFEVTGGSTSGAKLIPYTSAGLAAFRRAIFPWLADLLQKRPEIKAGRTYWAISPVTRQFAKTPGVIPVGMSNDAAYFGEELAECIAGLLAVPADFALISDIAEWRYRTALFLLAAEDLSFISVWSPTFLLQLVESAINQGERLIKDIASGGAGLPANPERARLVQAALDKNPLDTQMIWRQLDTVSCWASAGAKAFIPQLQELFPHVWIQGKGLLATEGAVTLPLGDCQAPVLAIESGFYEFMDDENQPHLCHQLVEDRVYRVVMTSHSGLYRYDTGDRVRVRGWKEQTPLLEFVGRAGLVSDLCGEKLTEEFVLHQLGNRRGFAMLAPSLQGKPHYVLFLDAAEYNKETAVALCRQLESALAENPQYKYARQLEQLGELVTHCVQNPMECYIKYALERGQRLGDIKPPVLSRETDWEKRMEKRMDRRKDERMDE
jgi:hypothetical protein